MYCKICGASLAPGDVFCKNCGASNTNSNPQPAFSQQPVQPQPVVAPIVEPVPTPEINQPLQENVQQPLQNDLAFQQSVVQNQTTPAYEMQQVPDQNMEPQATFTQPVQPPVNNVPEKKDNGKVLMIIGIIVGILAVAVIAYLIYSSLANNDKNDNNNGTTIVTKTNYNVSFANYVFTIDSDYNAIASGDTMLIDTGKWSGQITFREQPQYTQLTESILRRAYAASLNITSLESTSYSGMTVWQMKGSSLTDSTNITMFFAERQTGGVWIISMHGTNAPEQAHINELFSIVASAKTSENLVFSTIPEADLNQAVLDEEAAQNQAQDQQQAEPTE